jgi:hypothetical protein
MVARMEILLRGGDFAAEAGALFFCKRKNAQKAPLAGSGVQLVEKGRQLATFFSSYHPTCSKMYVG